MATKEVNFTSSNISVQAVTVTYWQETNFALLFRYMSPILIVVGTVGNLIAVITLQSRLFKSSSTSFLLSMLALCDVLVLNTGLMNKWLAVSFNIAIRSLTNYGCKVHTLLTYFAHHIASWTLVLLTIERTISVTFPLRCREICNRRRLIPVWVGMAVILFSSNIHFFFSYDIKETVTTTGNSSTSQFSCTVRSSWKSFFRGPWYWIDACLGDFIPFLLVAVGNGIIIIHLKRSSRMRTREMSVVGKNDGKTSSTTVLLILVSVIFLIGNAPMDVYFNSHVYLFSQSSPEQLAMEDLFYAGVTMLCYSNNAIEFILYFVSGRKFRSAFLDVFGCSNAPGKTSKIMNSGTKSSENGISVIEIKH